MKKTNVTQWALLAVSCGLLMACEQPSKTAQAPRAAGVLMLVSGPLVPGTGTTPVSTGQPANRGGNVTGRATEAEDVPQGATLENAATPSPNEAERLKLQELRESELLKEAESHIPQNPIPLQINPNEIE